MKDILNNDIEKFSINNNFINDENTNNNINNNTNNNTNNTNNPNDKINELLQLQKDMCELKDICNTLNDMTNIQDENLNVIDTNTEKTTDDLILVKNNMVSVTKTMSDIKKKIFVGSGIVATIGTFATGTWFAFPIIGISAVTIGMTYVKIK
jgi:hypothetical protein